MKKLYSLFAIVFTFTFCISQNSIMHIYQNNTPQVLNIPLSQIDSITYSDPSSVNLPSIVTSLNSFDDFSVYVSGEITDDGGGNIEQVGFVYSLSPNPTLSDMVSSAFPAGTDFYNFYRTIQNLYPNTTYHVRAYATNLAGTEYGNEVSFTTTRDNYECQGGVCEGDTLFGGIVAYLFQPDDPGYDPNTPHGIITSLNDLGTFEWGCYGTEIGLFLGGFQQIGAGLSNSQAIVDSCTSPSIAAKACLDLTLNGYSDWFLPSKFEMAEVQKKLGYYALFGINGEYWTSTEHKSGIISSTNTPDKRAEVIKAGFQEAAFMYQRDDKNESKKVRPIRYF